MTPTSTQRLRHEKAEAYRKERTRGKVLTEGESIRLFEELRQLPGFEGYRKRSHDQWMKRQEQKLHARAEELVRQELKKYPAGYTPSINDMAYWAHVFKLPGQVVATVVWEMVGEGILLELQVRQEAEQQLAAMCE
ncbi:hypothetical protein L226DRAFT_573471 [Lentinus tigrinus ALCF2SS1-7]|uniref:Uncharacterized protein n=1 Tax=Lentinus tigrinus ALCF2SS1-6 TaxID=1328759 RepID=A0A5C2S220_9APHY|nr:hypothetical protein L227DRAFT_613749 [Lentinus tigrinus ALCF2SS1-6]RPD72114.1 hypothetical protein L226DRAFT_573471 [Lentinus tigrinus ALCF2SS1-7]